MRVGFIGLGSQGAPMAHAILDAGFETTLWARRAASLEAYAATAAEIADSPAGLAAASDIVCLCVVGDADIRQLAQGTQGLLAGLQPGSLIVVHSTVHPDTCHWLAQRVAAQGSSVVDAPVSGGAPAVAQRQLLVMAGGEDEDIAKCRPIFESYGDPIVHLGPLGSGQVSKILNNLLYSANLGTAISLLDLGEALGLSRSSMCAVLGRGSANSRALEGVAAFGGDTAKLAQVAGALLQKDVGLAADLTAASALAEGVVFAAADAALQSFGYPRTAQDSPE